MDIHNPIMDVYNLIIDTHYGKPKVHKPFNYGYP